MSFLQNSLYDYHLSEVIQSYLMPYYTSEILHSLDRLSIPYKLETGRLDSIDFNEYPTKQYMFFIEGKIPDEITNTEFYTKVFLEQFVHFYDLVDRYRIPFKFSIEQVNDPSAIFIKFYTDIYTYELNQKLIRMNHASEGAFINQEILMFFEQKPQIESQYYQYKPLEMYQMTNREMTNLSVYENIRFILQMNLLPTWMSDDAIIYTNVDTMDEYYQYTFTDVDIYNHIEHAKNAQNEYELMDEEQRAIRFHSFYVLINHYIMKNFRNLFGISLRVQRGLIPYTVEYIIGRNHTLKIINSDLTSHSEGTISSSSIW